MTWELILGPSNPTIVIQSCIRIVAAVILGGFIGFNRERANRPVGFRSHILLCLGTTSIMMLPTVAGMPPDAISRFAGAIGAFIGVLALGGVLKPQDKEISGMTTAMTAVPTAGIGMTIGFGYVWLAFLLTLATLFVLYVLKIIEKRFLDK
jgi:putative Mg2+ transporter-C (MgtC) family protein